MLEVEKVSSLRVVTETRRGSSRSLDLTELDIDCLRQHPTDKSWAWSSGDIISAIPALINNRSMKFGVENAPKVHKPSGNSDFFQRSRVELTFSALICTNTSAIIIQGDTKTLKSGEGKFVVSHPLEFSCFQLLVMVTIGYWP